MLFPFTLRDALLRAPVAGVYQLHWSETILDEVRRNGLSSGERERIPPVVDGNR